MAAITFSNLPAEIHAIIAEHCKSNDLLNLCLTSKMVNERCLRILYCHVDLQLDTDHVSVLTDRTDYSQMPDTRKKQQQFAHALLSHPEYGRHVRFFKTWQYLPNFSDCDDRIISEEEFWRVMQSISHVQRVEVLSKCVSAKDIMEPRKQFPTNLFRSATSVRLVGSKIYDLALSILNNAINPATLKHLCIDMIEDYRIEMLRGDGTIIAHGAEPGLLTALTGRCTALQTLTWRKQPHYHEVPGYPPGDGWSAAAAQETAYIAWATFIRSVQGTLESFRFDLVGGLYRDLLPADLASLASRPCSIADETFQRRILPVFISGSWPCLTTIRLRGLRSVNSQGGEGTLAMELGAAFDGNTKVRVEEPRKEMGRRS